SLPRPPGGSARGSRARRRPARGTDSCQGTATAWSLSFRTGRYEPAWVQCTTAPRPAGLRPSVDHSGIAATGRFVRFADPTLRNQIPGTRGEPAMGRPAARDLTERELEVMHVFWSRGEATAAEARDRLAESGLDRTYTTIANLVRGLNEKGF